jgi:hypothetical protein
LHVLSKILTWCMGIGPSVLVALRGTHLSRRNSMTSRSMKRIRSGNSWFSASVLIRSKYWTISFCNQQKILSYRTPKL